MDYQQDQVFIEPQVAGSTDLAKGLRIGDELLSINGKCLASADQVQVALKIKRAEKIITLKLTPAELLPMNAPAATLDDMPPHIP